MAIDIKAELDAGATPRQLHERIEAEHRKQIDREIAQGFWRCPVCGHSLEWSTDGLGLVCNRHLFKKGT